MLVVFVVASWDSLAYHCMLRSAKDIEVGDSKDVVLDKMGKPTMEHFIDADYGTLFKVEYKYDWWA